MRGCGLTSVIELGRLMVLDNGERWEPEPFQVAILDALCRGVDVVWMEVPEGSGKSTLAAAIALGHLFIRPDANVPIGASSRDQAGIIQRQAGGIVRRSGRLRSRYRVQDGYRRVLCPETGGAMQVMAADERTGDGAIPTLAIIDELHRHRDLGLMRTWRGKLSKRNGQLLIISTAGEPRGEYEQAKAAALAVCRERGEVRREGCHTLARSPGFELHVWGLAEDEDLDDLDLVKRANPLSTVTVDTLRAKREDPTFQRQHWARFTCGVPQRSDDAAVSEAEWRALAMIEIPEGVAVPVGVDFGWRQDTTAIVPLWIPDPSCRVLGRPTIIVPPRDGTSTSPADIRSAFIGINRRNPIDRVCMDPSAGGLQFAEWLESDPTVHEDPDTGETWTDYESGLGVEVIEVPQSNTVQAAAFAAWMEALREGWLAHAHDEELTEHVLNAIAKPISHDRYRFDRPSPSRHASMQSRRVIDALIAASAVHWQATAHLVADRPRPVNVDDYRVEAI